MLRGVLVDDDAERSPAVAAAYDHCDALTRRAASNFAWALPAPARRAPARALGRLRLLPRRRRHRRRARGRRRTPPRLLARWREELDAAYAGRPRHPIGVALADAVQRFADRRASTSTRSIAASRWTSTRDRYETWEDDLARYCYRVAGAVGLICIEIFGYRTRRRASTRSNLGLAFQLTNILRDVAEDARARPHLPAARRPRAASAAPRRTCSPGRCTEAFREVMAFECARAGEHYGRARFLLAEEDRADARAGRGDAAHLRAAPPPHHRSVATTSSARACALTRPEKAGLAVAAWVRPHLRFLYRLAG